MIKAIVWFLTVWQLAVLLPLNVYFALGGHTVNLYAAAANVAFGLLALVMALGD